MNRFMLIIPLAILAVIVTVALVMLNATATGTRNTQSIGFSMAGQVMPDLALPRFGGDGVIRLSTMEGRVYAVNVFASWCGPCKIEASSIHALAETIPIIGVNYRDAAQDAAQFLAQFGNPYRVIGVDSDGAISIQMGVHGLPETFIIGADGVILYHHQGPVLADALEGAIATAIAKGRGE